MVARRVAVDLHVGATAPLEHLEIVARVARINAAAVERGRRVRFRAVG